MNKEDVFYGRINDERLRYTEKNEAIEMILDSYFPEPLPKTIELVRYVRSKINEPTETRAKDIVEEIIEYLDDDYGDPEYCEDQTSINEMIDVAKDFVSKIYDLYVPWTCEKESSEIIDCERWVREHAPNWIEEGVKFE